MERLELPRWKHKRHFDVFEGLEQGSCDHATEHPVKSLLAYHSQYIVNTTIDSTTSDIEERRGRKGFKEEEDCFGWMEGVTGWMNLKNMIV